jgi:chromosome segregation ATPase
VADTTDDGDRIAALETQLDELRSQLKDVRRQLSEAELDQWRARIDDLEVQAHLGSLEVKQRLDPLVEDLRNRWLDAREQVSNSADTASEVIDTLRKGLEHAMGEIRRSLVEAKSAAQH